MGHAGTLISALLLLINKGWRNSLNRFAEAMTVFAVLQAAIYPILHLGRPWLFYWLIPYPNTMEVWPQFKSPLVWDVFAVGTYLIVSVLFWYIGLIPDLATVRDRARRRTWQVFFGLLCLGWRKSAIHWRRWQIAYWTTAGLALPLVISVHSGVSMLFAVGLEPGWHTTILPPYFVLGAVFEGFAVVLLISITLRHAFGLQHLVTDRHLDVLAKLLLAFGLRLRLRCFWRVIFGRRIRARNSLRPLGRGVRLGVLGSHRRQLRSAPGALVPPGALQRACAAEHRRRRYGRHVARTLHARGKHALP